MKIQLGAALLAVTFCAGIACAGVQISGGSADDRTALQQISVDWLEAYASGNLDKLMSIMHDDALVMPHNQPSSRGTDEVREYFATRIGRDGVEFVDNLQEIRINGSWAYVLGTFKLRVETGDPDKPYLHNGRYLVLYEKTPDGWKMLRDMDNLDPQPTGAP